MIYFDNSAASYPKPDMLLNKAKATFKNYSFNIGRGGYLPSLKTAQKVFDVRELLGEMFGFSAENIAFTKNCTEALNFAIKGVCEKGCNFIISPFEHNSVYRVVNKLKTDGIADFAIAKYCENKDDFINSFRSLINEKTKAIILTHTSNVFGIRMPVKELAKLCKERGILFILDASQGAGISDINAIRDNIDIICSSGQKALYGPSGTGFIGVRDGITLRTVAEGGTGSNSLEPFQPDFMPDRLESGTLNAAGIILLGYGIKFINKIGTDEIYSHELSLIRSLYSILYENKNVNLYTSYPESEKSMPVLSFNFKNYSSEKTAALLSENNICVRGGYHCSPLAHKTMNTLETGTVRLSAGYFNTLKECDKFYKVLKKL